MARLPQADQIEGVTPYRQPMVLFRNKHDRTFEDVSKAAGFENLRQLWRGLAVATQ